MRVDMGGDSSVGVYEEKEGGVLRLIVKIVFVDRGINMGRIRLPWWQVVGLIHRTTYGYYLKWERFRKENGHLRRVGEKGEVMTSKEDDTTPSLEEVRQEIEGYGLRGQIIYECGSRRKGGGLFFKCSCPKGQGDALNELFFKIFLKVACRFSPRVKSFN